MDYDKIETLFNRDPKTFKVIEGDYRLEEFKLIQEWLITEKIHGMNTHVVFKPTCEVVDYEQKPLQKVTVHEVLYYGRSNKTVIPKDLLKYLQKKFTVETFNKNFEVEPDTEIHIFGEGYGVGINNGGNYCQGVSFRIFDVFVCDKENPLGGWWLELENIIDVANKFEVETVPLLGYRTTEEIIELVKSGRFSLVASMENDKYDHVIEGVVARSKPLLFTRKGERLMWKLKVKDFKGGKDKRQKNQ